MAGAALLSPEELRAVESAAAARGLPLMERAGAATADWARRMARDSGGTILVVAGPGNNGGDAWVAAHRLAESFHRVVVLDVEGTAPRAEAARRSREALRALGGVEVREWPAGPFALVIDGLLGIGLARDVDGRHAGIVERINAARAPVLAIDVPSGLDSATGRTRGIAVRATRTLTFLALKPGLLTGDGPACCGAIAVDDLGAAAQSVAARGTRLDADAVAAWLAPRRVDAHKGHFGTVGIIGGTRGMVGAALLAGRAALLGGAGKVRVALLAPDAPAADALQPELMLGTIDDVMEADVLVVGPGAGRSPSATSLSLFERSVLPAAIASGKPQVLDADALNAVAVHEALAEPLRRGRSAGTVLTPHPAEAARLLRRTTAEVQADRVAAAREIAKRYGAEVVLKGVGSVCASPDGRYAINTTGNPGLASAGTGDVLAGLVGALLGQGLDAAQALRYGVCLHGAAADALAGRGIGPIGMTAGEVALEARAVLNRWADRNAPGGDGTLAG